MSTATARMQVLDAMTPSHQETVDSVRLYENYVDAMAMLRMQRASMAQQLRASFEMPDADWAALLSDAALQQKTFLSASATIETLHIWQRKETELYCELLTNIAVDVRTLLSVWTCACLHRSTLP